MEESILKSPVMRWMPLEEVYEPFLIKEGFIVRTPRGREATDLAYSHLGLEKNRIEQDSTLF